MTRRISVILCLLLCSIFELNAQSFSELLTQSEQVKSNYGEKDDRYLESLSKAISAAFAEKKNEEAHKYRLIHADIVKDKYGEVSLEYAEDLWRLGNVSAFKGESYTFDLYKKAETIYENLNAQKEYPYCDIMQLLYNHYYKAKNWYVASKYLNRYISNCESWVGKEWKGISVHYINWAHGHLLLGELYLYKLLDTSSAYDAYLKCVTIIEEHKLFKDYKYSWMPYSRLSIICTNNGKEEEAVKWQAKLVDVLAETGGSESDNYLQELSNLRYKYYKINNLDSIKTVSRRLLSSIESKDKKLGLPLQNDSLYLKAWEELVIFCSIFQEDSAVVKEARELLNFLTTNGLDSTEDHWVIEGNLIQAYLSTKHYDEAYALFVPFEDLAQRLNLCETEDFWHYLIVKSDVLSALYKIEELDKTLNEAILLTEKIFGPYSRQALAIRYQWANKYKKQEKAPEVLTEIEKCYTILNSGQCSFETPSDSLRFMALIHSLEGGVIAATNPTKAEEILQRALEECNKLGIQDPSLFINLGSLFLEQKRDYRKAIVYFERAKQIQEQIGDNFSVDYITILNNLALCYQELGINDSAIAVLDLANNLLEKSYGKNNPLYAVTAQNISKHFFLVADYDTAVKYGEAALQSLKSFYGPESEKYASALQNLGLFYQQNKNYVKSKDLLLEAAAILERLKSKNSIYAYVNLINISAIEKDFDNISTLIDRCESIIKKNGWENTDVEANLYGTVGYCLAIYGNPAAKDYLGLALEILNKAGKKNTIQYYEGLLYFGQSLFLDGSFDEKIIPALVSGYKLQYLNNAGYLNSKERESYISGPRLSQTKNLLFSSRKEGSEDKWLYDFLLFNKGLLLGTSLNFAKAIYDSNDGTLIDQYQKLLLLNKFISGEDVIIDGCTTLEDGKREASLLEREITQKLRQLGDYSNSLNLTYNDIRNSLDDRTLAVEFVNYSDFKDNISYYAALIARKDFEAPLFVRLCKTSDLEKLMTASPDKLYSENLISQNLYKLIWEPISSQFSDIKTIVFSPSGYLNRLAVEQLFDGEHRLSELYDVVRVTSTREICTSKKQYKYTSAVLYGGLDYDEDDTTMITESKKIRGSQSSNPNILRRLDSSFTRNGWTYLPGSLTEVNNISSLIKKNHINSEVFSGTKGNEESFKALNGKNFGILHIATHGFYITPLQAEQNTFFAENPLLNQSGESPSSSLIRSGLLLSGANKAWKGESVPEGVEDGILTAAEIANLNLNSCDIVVLSACETGLGEITDEGVFGLQRAFKNAGVNTIIMSLWEVDDQATALMMQTFYKNLFKEKTKREAFFIAQTEVRKKYSDPRYWAAFIMLD